MAILQLVTSVKLQASSLKFKQSFRWLNTGSSMTYLKEIGKKWENEHGNTSHMKVLMAHDAEEYEKECTATAPCIAFTFMGIEIRDGSRMEICALKAPKDAVNLVSAGEEMISGRLDGERPSVHGKELESTICLSCLPGLSVLPLID